MIYLDQAATSHPKPRAVTEAVVHWLEELGVSAGRGDSRVNAEVSAKVRDTRRRVAELCGMPEPSVAFTSGATESLNLFLAGFLRPGDAVLTTALEHSSLVRPLVHLAESRSLHIEVLSIDESGDVSPDRFEAALTERPYRLVAFSHASNVIGNVLDATRIVELSHGHGATCLVDASQTAGLFDLDLGADAVVASAHKGLLAPPGLGFLAVREGVPVELTRFGGTGSSRALDRQPTTWPTAFEAGTPNTPAILGLAAALDFLEERGRVELLATELEWIDQLRGELTERFGDAVTCHGRSEGPRVPVLSFTVAGIDPAEAGMLFDAAGIHLRTGFHCAPWIHAALGTEAGGTIRASVGPFTTADDVRAVTRALPGR